MKLREYQDDLVAKVKDTIRSRIRSMVVRSATGSGKTALTAHMLNGAAEKGNMSWFIVHRRELVKQSVKTFAKMGVTVGVIGAGFNQDLSSPIQVCSIQTLVNRMDKLPIPQLVVWDECHHAAATSWRKVRAGAASAVHIGLTATPERRDGKGLKDLFDTIIEGPATLWLIEQGFLSDYRLYNSNPPDLSKVATAMGDYATAEIEKIMNEPKITGDAVSHYLRLAHGKRAIVFCVSIAHSQEIVSQFHAAGISARHVDGETPNDERDAAIEAFEKGEIKVLSNCDLFGEGFDLPGIECVILLRPTKSLGLYLQQVGRGLRPVYADDYDLETQDGRLTAIADGEKPYAIILDHAGNSERHGLPCEPREWSLEGKKGRKKKGDSESAVRVKNCPECELANQSFRRVCKYCGAPFEIMGREVEQVDGTLREVGLAEARRAAKVVKKTEERAAKTFEDLVKLAYQRGYKDPTGWAMHYERQRSAWKNKPENVKYRR